MTTPIAADWYPDPFGRHEHRYWDGAQWTDHAASDGCQVVDWPVPATLPESVAGPEDFQADWYPDPTGRHDVRYWDGTQWTEHVSSGGHQGIDRLHDVITTDPTAFKPNKKVAAQARKVIADKGVVGATLFTEPVLVVNQKVRMFGSTMCYDIFDQRGNQLGWVEEVPRGFKAKASDSFYRRTDDSREYKFRIVDVNRRTQLTITRPAKWMSGKSKMVIEDPTGVPIGYITQETYGVAGAMATVAHAALKNVSGIAGAGIGLVAGATAGKAAASAAGKSVGWIAGKAVSVASASTARAVLHGSGAADRIVSAADGMDRVGHVRFGLEANGMRVGSVHAETTKEWDFRVLDSTGAEFARVTKTWAGWSKEHLTKSDNYVVQLGRPLEEPLRSLALALALAIDIALKQGSPASDASASRRRR